VRAVLRNRRPVDGAGEARRFFTVAEAARLCGLSEMTIYRAIHAGEFPAVRIRGRYIVPAKALDEMEGIALNTSALVDAADWAREGGVA
jgi:excisionase family DNA binding protein